MKNSHSFFLILAICVTIFVTAVFGYMYQLIGSSLERTVKARTAISSAALAKSREQDFLQAYNATASKWASLSDYFVKSDKIVSFIEAVESLGEQSDSKVVISSINADNLSDSPVGTEGVLRMHVTVQGPWASVMRTLSLAEVLPYKTSVSNVQASASTDVVKVSVKDKAESPTKVIWNLSFDMQVAVIVASSTLPSIK